MGSPSSTQWMNNPKRGAFFNDNKSAWWSALGTSALTGYYGGWFKEGSWGRKAFDPLGIFNSTPKPPTPANAPPPADTTASMLREISRAQTDQQLQQSKRSMLYGGTT